MDNGGTKTSINSPDSTWEGMKGAKDGRLSNESSNFTSATDPLTLEGLQSGCRQEEKGKLKDDKINVTEN